MTNENFGYNAFPGIWINENENPNILRNVYFSSNGGTGTYFRFLGSPPKIHFEYEWPFEYNAWGNNSPVINEVNNSITIENVTGSEGFYITFESMGYTLNTTDILVITYHIDIERPEAVLLLKQVIDNDYSVDVNQSLTEYGIGMGRDVVLGNVIYSNYEAGAVVDGKTLLSTGTYDPATKIGTFEIHLKTFNQRAIGISFQHNYWSTSSSTEWARESKYTIKFLKIENIMSD